MTATMPYVESQSAVDALFPDGGRYYWKSHFVDEITDELIDTLVALDAHRPSPQSVIMIRTLGGAIGGVGDHETAYPHRSARFNVSVDASWQDPELDDVAIAWARSTWDAIAPYATGGVYINFAGLGDDANLRAAHSAPTRSGRRDPPGLRPRQPPRRRRTPAMSPERLRSPSAAPAHRQRSSVAAVRAWCQPIRPQADKHNDERQRAAQPPLPPQGDRRHRLLSPSVRPQRRRPMNELLAAVGMALLAITSVGLWTLRVALTARRAEPSGRPWQPSKPSSSPSPSRTSPPISTRLSG